MKRSPSHSATRGARRTAQRRKPAGSAAPIEFAFPLPRTHCGVPLGNGLFGVLVWGGNGRLNLTVNRADFWDHRAGELTPGHRLYEELQRLYEPGDPSRTDEPFEHVGRARPKGAFFNTRLPMGRFELVLARGTQVRRGILGLTEGSLELELTAPGGADAVIRIALHPRRSALIIEDPSGLLRTVTPRPAWEWVREAMVSRDFQPPVVIRKRQEAGWIQACPDDPSMAALCCRRGRTLVVVMVPGPDPDRARTAAGHLVAEVFAGGTAAFFAETREWHSRYWQDLPAVQLPDPAFDRLLRFALHKFAAATSPESPVPSALQGPWCEEYQMPPWSGDYHFNANIQQIYALAFPTGKTAHLRPLFDMLDRCQGLFRLQAERVAGIPDGLLMTHTTDDRGYACGGVGPAACIDHAVSGWTAQLYWLCYAHTGDREFLRDRAFPFMRGVMRVYEEMLEWHRGVPRLPIGISAEYGHLLPDGQKQRVGPDPSYQLACIHMLAGALLEASSVLGLKPDPIWRKIRDKLPRWTVIGRGKSARIAVWKNQDLETSHRHHSHLAAIYPFDTAGGTDADHLLENSLRHWIDKGMSDWSEWSFAWAAILQARRGFRESPRLLLRIYQELFLNEGLASVYLPRFRGFTNHAIDRMGGDLSTSEIMQLDGTMGFASAVYEMLAHSAGGTVRFFPAVPADWKDVRFANLRLPGPLLVSGEKRDGRISQIGLASPNGGRFRIDVPGHGRLAIRNGRNARRIPLPAHVDLKPGEHLEGIPE